MSSVSTQNLLKTSGTQTAPAGFVLVPSSKLTVPRSNQDLRIEYQAFHNPDTNELIITGTPKPQPLGGNGMGNEPTVADAGIFHDSSRVLSGPLAGGFVGDKPVPVAQTESLAEQLTNPKFGDFPNATITFVGEGSVGLAFSVASYNLRNDPSGAANVDTTVTFNSWQGTWTPDGSPDTGVLEVRTPNPANGGDPGYLHGFRSGGTVLIADTGVNGQLVGGLTDIGVQLGLDGVGSVLGKIGDAIGGISGWLFDKSTGAAAEAGGETVVDWTSGKVVDHFDGPVAAGDAIGWKGQLSPTDAVAAHMGGFTTLGHWNVQQGLSPSGYEVGTTHYEPAGKAVTIGTGSTASISQSMVQVSTYKDPVTGAIMEVRLSGTQVDGQFIANGGQPLVIGMDTAGRTVLTGAAAQTIAAAQLNPTTGNASGGAPGTDGTTISAPGPWSDYDSVSIQNHKDGTTSFTFQGEGGQTAWVLPNGEGGRVVVLTSDHPVEGEARTIVYDLNAVGQRVGQPRYYDGQGLEVTETGAPLPPAYEAPHYSHTQDITNANGSVTRVVDVVDKETGQVLSSYIYENTDPSNPDGYKLVGTKDYENDTGWTLDRESGQMQQEDSAGPPRHVVPAANDPFNDALLDAFENPQVPVGEGTQLADAGGNGTWTDGGPQYGGGLPNTSAPSNPASFAGYLQGAGAALPLAQQVGLENALAGLNLGGIDELGFVTLPSGNNTFILNADGDIVGELYTDDAGQSRISSHRILPDGSVRAADDYVLPSGQVMSQQQYEQAQAQQAAGAIGLMTSIIGLQHWDAMTDLQRTAAVASIYNAVDALSGNALPGNLGAAAGALGLLTALESGNVGAALYSGLYLVESLTATAATSTTAAVPGLVTDTLGANFLPALGFVLALDSGNPLAIVGSGMSLLSSLSVLGPWGMVAGVVLTLFSGFMSEDIPMSEGAAHAQWDADGKLQIVTDQDEHGGGPTAQAWMSALAHGLQDELARHTDEHGAPLYGLIPNLLPTIGFKHDPDGFNYGRAQGHLFLSWVDDNGVTQTRYYDGAGNRNDGTGETLAGDFMQHAMDAIAPAWAVDGVAANDGRYLLTA